MPTTWIPNFYSPPSLNKVSIKPADYPGHQIHELYQRWSLQLIASNQRMHELYQPFFYAQKEPKPENNIMFMME
jgi:hypothetical protein